MSSHGSRRIVPTLLAAAAVFGVTLPLMALFTPARWSQSTTAIIGVVFFAGIGLRLLTRRPVAIMAGQVLVWLWATLNLCLGETTWSSLPTGDTLPEGLEALQAAQQAVLQSAAPVSLVPGLVLALTLVVGLLAIAVDLLAVTLRLPAAAGLPLLAGFIAIAANSGEGLHPGYFLLPSLAWVGLLGHDGLERLQQWGGSVARSRGGAVRDPSGQVLNLARGLGLVGITVALALPGVLPHVPPTFFADGLGRSDAGRGGGAGSLNDLLDVSRNLQAQSDAEVFHYTTTISRPPPLRVDVLTDFDGTHWTKSLARVFNTNGVLPAPDQIRGRTLPLTDIPRLTGETLIRDNRLTRPQAAVPGTPTSIDIPPDAWRIDANGVLRLLDAQSTYSVSFEELEPRASDYGQRAEENPPLGGSIDSSAATTMLDKVLAQIAPVGLSPAETAQRIQSYLRSTQFTYALDLAPTRSTDEQGNLLSGDPVTQFLVTRRGYCVQFATAMALLARERGIPARIGIGFLPGTLQGTTWTVVGKDAHAWPELWFADVGWLRFEPTPSARTGLAPGWTLQPTDASTSSPTAGASTPSPTGASDRPELTQTPPTPSADAGVFSRVGAWIGDHAVSLLMIITLALAGALVPVGAMIGRRRALRSAQDDIERVEVLWRSMLTRLGDMDLQPEPGDTPRQVGQRLGQDAHLDDEARGALDTVVSTLEKARYARHPKVDLAELDEATEQVVKNAQSRTSRRTRLRATLWPREGRDVWAALGRAVASAPGRLLTAYQRRQSKRPPD